MKSKIFLGFIALFVLVILGLNTENDSNLFNNSKFIAQGYGEDNSAISNSTIQSCNCVAFRLDDIMDYIKTDAQIQVIKVFAKEGVPLTIGIPGNRFGEDHKLVDFIKEQLKDDNLEIANHGWDHESFTEFTKKYQSILINQTNNKLDTLLGVSPKVFIPPFNNFDQTTINALQENGMTHMSSAFRKDPSPYPLNNATLYRFPAGADTGTDDGWTGSYLVLTHTITFSNIETSLAKYGFAVVMMHPKEFTTMKNGEFTDEVNWDQIHELELLIQTIQDNGLIIVPLGKINLDSKTMELPAWMKNNAKWWSQGQIDDNTFIQGIEFLIKNNIIIVPLTGSESDNSQQIPEWIKNNAKWWADDQITDNEFVTSIQYLIKVSILKLNN